MGQSHPNCAGPQCIFIGRCVPALTEPSHISARAELGATLGRHLSTLRIDARGLFDKSLCRAECETVKRTGFRPSIAAYLREIVAFQQDLSENESLRIAYCLTMETQSVALRRWRSAQAK